MNSLWLRGCTLTTSSRPATSRPSDDEAMELVDNCYEGGWAIGRLDKLEQADGAEGGTYLFQSVASCCWLRQTCAALHMGSGPLQVTSRTPVTMYLGKRLSQCQGKYIMYIRTAAT